LFTEIERKDMQVSELEKLVHENIKENLMNNQIMLTVSEEKEELSKKVRVLKKQNQDMCHDLWLAGYHLE
jgi:hypothetical protein